MDQRMVQRWPWQFYIHRRDGPSNNIRHVGHKWTKRQWVYETEGQLELVQVGLFLHYWIYLWAAIDRQSIGLTAP